MDLTNIRSAMCGGHACIAVKLSGNAVAWGDPRYGGDTSTVELMDIAEAMCGEYACVARYFDGTAVSWGSVDSGEGGPIDTSTVDLTNFAKSCTGKFELKLNKLQIK